MTDQEKKIAIDMLIEKGLFEDPKTYISKMHGSKLDIYEDYIYKGDKVIRITECEVS